MDLINADLAHGFQVGRHLEHTTSCIHNLLDSDTFANFRQSEAIFCIDFEDSLRFCWYTPKKDTNKLINKINQIDKSSVEQIAYLFSYNQIDALFPSQWQRALL